MGMYGDATVMVTCYQARLKLVLLLLFFQTVAASSIC